MVTEPVETHRNGRNGRNSGFSLGNLQIARNGCWNISWNIDMSCATQTGIRILHRVKGRPAIERSLRATLIRVHRFALARATTPADRMWAARTIAGLETVLEIAGAADSTTTEAPL